MSSAPRAIPPDPAVVHDRPVHPGEGPGVHHAARRRQLGRQRRRRVPLARHEVAAVVQHHEPGDRVGLGQRLHQEAGEGVARLGIGRGHQPGDPVGEPLRQPDVEVEAQRRGDLVGDEAAEAATGHPPDDLADQEAEGEGVVAVPGARLPERRLGGQPSDHVVPVVEAAGGDGVAQRGQPGLVVQQVPDEHTILAGRRELGPVGGDGGVDVQLAGRGQQVGRERRGPLGRRHGHAQRVLLPRAGALGVGVAAPQVDDRLTVHGDGDRGPQLAPLGEVALELLGDAGEPLVAVALHVHRSYPLVDPSAGSVRRPDGRA